MLENWREPPGFLRLRGYSSPVILINALYYGELKLEIITISKRERHRIIEKRDRKGEAKSGI